MYVSGHTGKPVFFYHALLPFGNVAPVLSSTKDVTASHGFAAFISTDHLKTSNHATAIFTVVIKMSVYNISLSLRMSFILKTHEVSLPKSSMSFDS